MYRKTFRIHSLYLAKCMLYFVNILTDKTKYYIHIYIIKAFFSCHIVYILYLFYSMLPAYQIKRFLIHRLWIDRDSSNIMFLKHLKLIKCYAIRTTCFYCEFMASIYIKQSFKFCYQSVKLRCTKCCWCTTTKVYCIKSSPLHCS